MPNTAQQSQADLLERTYQWLEELSTEDGINASGKDEIYGCIFGRDSAITILKILRAHNRQPNTQLLETVRRALVTLVSLQGKEFNIESGEEPGKFIHEFRKDKMERLTSLPRPWYVYPDGYLRNYDSVDSTPLCLIALYKYYEATHDGEFLMSVLPAVESGLNWIISFGDKDKDFLLEYEFPPNRKHGGLVVHSWADSRESIVRADGTMPKYPIAAVEAQGFAWEALKLWAGFYATQSPDFARKLEAQAKGLKQKFNQTFIIKDHGKYYLAQAVDGDKRQIKTVTGHPMMCLWASVKDGARVESIIDEEYIVDVVTRAFMPDMFDPDGGIRTMSKLSPTYNATEQSYHNGSFWPMLNGLAHEGLELWGFDAEAAMLKRASLKPIEHFGSPIELYIKSEDGKYVEYRSRSGNAGCRVQAWSAAATLDWLTN